MPSHAENIGLVQEAIGYVFEDVALLTTALTHSSFAAEKDVESYERLEFLGDAVLELAVTEEIFRNLQDASEGHMTRIRSVVVDEASLAEIAGHIGLSQAIRLGVGEDRAGGRDRSSILSDVLESVLGAVHIDGGSESSFRVVLDLLGDTIADRMAASEVSDARSSLQERLAQTGQVVVFEYERSGPDHEVVYAASAIVDGGVIGTGTGGSKKTAAIDAARHALTEGV